MEFSIAERKSEGRVRPCFEKRGRHHPAIAQLTCRHERQNSHLIPGFGPTRSPSATCPLLRPAAERRPFSLVRAGAALARVWRGHRSVGRHAAELMREIRSPASVMTTLSKPDKVNVGRARQHRDPAPCPRDRPLPLRSRLARPRLGPRLEDALSPPRGAALIERAAGLFAAA